MRCLSRRDRGHRRVAPRGTRLGALLLVLLNLLLLSLPSGQAFASSLGSALSAGATSATQAVGGDASRAPVLNATAQTARNTAAPALQTVAKTAAPVVKTATTAIQSTGKTVAPVLDTAVHTVDKTVAPVLKTATQTLSKTAAPVLQTATQTLSKTTAPVLKTATQTLSKTTAPVLQTATQTLSDVTAPAGQTAASTIAGVVQSVDGASALVSKVASTSSLSPSSSAPLAAITREPHLPLGAATRGIPDSSFSSSPPGAQIRPPVDTLPVAPTTPAPVAGTTILSTPASYPPSAQAGNPAGSSSGPPTCVASTGLTKEELVESCELASIGRLWSVSIAGPLQGLGGQLPAPFATSRAGDNSRRAGTPPASSSSPPAPAPSPLPGGFSSAMASAAGVAFSIFLSLVGLLLVGGLATMRLLRLASEPRRAALFVLIPERPG